jgi:hypothetical protein
MKGKMIVRCPSKFPEGAKLPTDLRSADEWNVFWRNVLDYWQNAPLYHFLPSDQRFRSDFQMLAELKHRELLFAGNGVSRMPYFAAHEGFHAHALDISSVAAEYVAAHPADLWMFRWFYLETVEQWKGEFRGMERVQDQALTQQAIERAFRPGGSVSFETADLFAVDRSAPVHTIVAQLIIELYDREHQRELARRFYQWLKPGGILIVESFQGLSLVSEEREAVEGVEPTFEEAGFFIHRKAAYQWRREQCLCAPCNLFRAWKLNSRSYQQKLHTEFLERCQVIHTADIERLHSGDKMVIFRYGGGC